MGVCERGASGGEDPGEVGAMRRCLSLLHCLPPAQPWPLSWSRFRLLCHRIITHKMFDHVVLVIIFLNCITIAMERPKIDPHSAVSPWDYTQWLLSACSVPGPSWVSKQGGRGGPERHRGREPGLPLRSPLHPPLQLAPRDASCVPLLPPSPFCDTPAQLREWALLLTWVKSELRRTLAICRRRVLVSQRLVRPLCESVSVGMMRTARLAPVGQSNRAAPAPGKGSQFHP